MKWNQLNWKLSILWNNLKLEHSSDCCGYEQFHSNWTLVFQQAFSSSVIKGTSQHISEANSFLSASTTQAASCTVKSTGAEGILDAPVR